MSWWIVWVVLLALFLFWANRRTRGRGTKKSGGGQSDHPSGKYIF